MTSQDTFRTLWDEIQTEWAPALDTWAKVQTNFQKAQAMTLPTGQGHSVTEAVAGLKTTKLSLDKIQNDLGELSGKWSGMEEEEFLEKANNLIHAIQEQMPSLTDLLDRWSVLIAEEQ